MIIWRTVNLDDCSFDLEIEVEPGRPAFLGSPLRCETPDDFYGSAPVLDRWSARCRDHDTGARRPTTDDENMKLARWFAGRAGQAELARWVEDQLASKAVDAWERAHPDHEEYEP